MTAAAKKMTPEEHEKYFLALAREYMAPKPQRDTWEKAQTVLKLETLHLVLETKEIKYSGHKILERWAVNQPDELKELESKSKAGLLMRLIRQQNLEDSVMETERAKYQRRNGLAVHEILEMHNISMSIPLL